MYFTKRKAIQSIQRLLARLHDTTKLVAGDPNDPNTKQEQEDQQGREHTLTHKPRHDRISKPSKWYIIVKGAKSLQQIKGGKVATAKHPPDQTKNGD